ncbi:MerR family DNA-binding protein [Streptomyces sp. NPDC059153]|uniref:MerR family DNA-binding protein n=1 Tax=unclassified Streptomyces TaxID=2593676 RepID=UPI00367658FB
MSYGTSGRPLPQERRLRLHLWRKALHKTFWLNLCIILRASGMPLPEIRRYTELARQGAGNEQERMELLRGHQDQVADQMKQLEQCLDIINFKVRVYEDILDGAGGHSCDAAVRLGNEERRQTTEPLSP